MAPKGKTLADPDPTHPSRSRLLLYFGMRRVCNENRGKASVYSLQMVAHSSIVPGQILRQELRIHGCITNITCLLPMQGRSTRGWYYPTCSGKVLLRVAIHWYLWLAPYSVLIIGTYLSWYWQPRGHSWRVRPLNVESTRIYHPSFPFSHFASQGLAWEIVAPTFFTFNGLRG